MFKRISVKFASKEELEHFLELLPVYVKTEYYAIVRGNNVYIQLSGSPADIKRSAAVVKTAAGIARAKIRPLRSYPLDMVFAKAEVVAPVPPDVLADYLEASGHRAKLRGLDLQTDATFEEVTRALERLSAVYKTLEKYPVSPHAKRVVALYIAVKRVSPEEALERLTSIGILNKGDVYSIRGNLAAAKKALLAVIGRT